LLCDEFDTQVLACHDINVDRVLRSLKYRAWRWQRIVRSRLGIASTIESPDRAFQESVAIPRAAAAAKGGGVLYVGVSWYTYKYWRRYFKGVRLTTLDIDPGQAVYGARDHVVGDLDASLLGARPSFDVILLLGILGYGINDRAGIMRAMTSISRLLKTDGICLLTVEEGGRAAELDSGTVARIARESGFALAPISEWYCIAQSAFRTRYYVLGRHPDFLSAFKDSDSEQPLRTVETIG
jgi:SAM-dependent methyltransferase